jgi:hypothetical protein
MTTDTSLHTDTLARVTSPCANALADRLEQGARALMTFATGLTDEEWRIRTPHDGRTVGVIVHHVASVYPIEFSWRRPLQKQAGNRRDHGTSAPRVWTSKRCRHCQRGS